MANLDQSLSLQEYIGSLTPSSLPRIVKICSGVYFQSSIYEISGNEVSLSNGDLVKIISFKLQKIICKDSDSATSVDLAPDFPGHFMLIPDQLMYSSVKDIARVVPDGKDSEPFSFASRVDFTVNKHPIKGCQPIFWRGISSDSKYAKCIIREEHGNACIKIPMACKGDFYECGTEQRYTLGEILQFKDLLSQQVTCSSLPGNSLSLTPVYEVQAIMQLRPTVVKIPSDLEVDVVDVTKECRHVKFIKTQTLREVLEYEHAFPLVAELLETPEHNPVFRSDWVCSLKKGQKVVFHEKASSWKILTSTKGRKASRYFLISSSYKGKFKRRPREFATVYDLLTCLKTDKELRVVVTKDCECIEDEFPCLCVGDRLKILYQTTMIVSVHGVPQETDVVAFTRNCDDDEEPENIMLPMYAEGQFVEEVTDSKRYAIADIIEAFKLPCEVKVAVKDSSVANDILASFTALKLEEIVGDPFVVASLLRKPSDRFELPLKWFDMSLFFTEDLPEVPKELTCISNVEELTDVFYYNLRKLLPSSGPPPPRPPKRQSLRSAEPQKEIAKVMQRKMSLPIVSDSFDSTLEGPPPPPYPRKSKKIQPPVSNPNDYAPNPSKKKMSVSKSFIQDDASSDDEHDYEHIDDVLQSTITKLSEAVLHC